MLFERGANAKQVQRWLGHHSAAFTLDRYIHLLDGNLGVALDLDAELSKVQTIRKQDPHHTTDIGDVETRVIAA